jgi:hypothetical protein
VRRYDPDNHGRVSHEEFKRALTSGKRCAARRCAALHTAAFIRNGLRWNELPAAMIHVSREELSALLSAIDPLHQVREYVSG